MPLSTGRIVFQGETPYPHEREAIDFLIDGLPNTDPYHAWALLDLLDTSSGRLYEIDAVVLGYSALYVVEIKSGPGKYQGDFSDAVPLEAFLRRHPDLPFFARVEIVLRGDRFARHWHDVVQHGAPDMMRSEILGRVQMPMQMRVQAEIDWRAVTVEHVPAVTADDEPTE